MFAAGTKDGGHGCVAKAGRLYAQVYTGLCNVVFLITMCLVWMIVLLSTTIEV